MNESISGYFEDWEHLDRLKKSYYSHLSGHQIRRESWERSKRENAVVEREGRPVSMGEWKSGRRKETLEWEARGAILSLWKKGYTTYYSGYEGSDGLQVIHLVSPKPPPKEILKRVWRLTDVTGILTWSTGAVKLEKDELCKLFNQGRPVWIWGLCFIYAGGNPHKIKEHWDKVAAVLPDLGWKQLVCDDESTRRFRKEHILETETG